MNFSTEQSAIFDFFASGTGNAAVRARAGTGKTTTIKAAFEHAPENRILYAVFNKKNQREAEGKITDCRVDVKTLHSLGFGFIKKVWRDAKPDDEVEVDRAYKVLATFPFLRDDKEFVGAVIKLVGFLKNLELKPTQQSAYDIAESRDVLLGRDAKNDRALVSSALQVLELSKIKDSQGRISFNDMVWLPVAMGWVKPHYNLVVVDEAQDMNLPQLMMARGASSGRVVVVGDDRQAIYGFRGAAQDGLGMMKITLRAKEFSLTTTYRCPKSVVRIAAEIVPDYKAADSAPEGEVGSVSDIENHVKIGDAILSRLNAPLMPLALSLLRKNIPARIEGRDIGRQLIGMVRTMKAKSVTNFIERVEAWLAKQIERLQKSKGAEKKIEQSRDISETLKALAMDCENVAEIESRITNLFQDSDSNSKPAVVLSSVHKAKGLEWPRVFLLSETFRQKSGTGEEANIYYVAVTRAMKALYFVGGDAPQVKELSPQSAENKGNSQILPDGSQIIYSPSGGKPLLVPSLPPHFDSTKLQPVRVEIFPREEARSLESKKQTGTESETDMSNKSKKTKKAAAPKAAAKSTGEKKTQVSYAGRGERIAELVAAKKTDNQILEIIKSEFPGSSTSPVMKTIASKKAKAAKGKSEAAKPAKAEKKPVAKADKKKGSKKAANPETTEPAPAVETSAAEEAPKMTPPPRPGTTQE